MDRPNLDVHNGALVNKVLFDGPGAVGVDYSRFGRRGSEQASGNEGILCGGAINSPQLLQLSGVGNARDLRTFGIDVVADGAGGGENLQHHLEVYIQYGSKLRVSEMPALKWQNKPKVGAEWILRHTGPAATNHLQGGGFVRGNER